MSPFSRCLIELRRRHGLRQGALATLVGYEQSYLCALEVGLKGPPTPEFVKRLGGVLSLTADELYELDDALAASQRKLTVPLDAEEDVFWLLKDLREQLPALSPLQVRMIRDILRLRDPQTAKHPLPLKSHFGEEEARM